MYEDWVSRRIDLAERLAAGECGGSSAEAILILSSLISGIAADLWPGTRIDRHRFVELWSLYSDPSQCGNLISVPLLIDDLERAKNFALADRLREQNADAFSPRGLPDTRVVTGEDVDLFEADLASLVPELPVSDLRKFSYGNVFYVQFRSGYVHEYQVGTHGEAVVMSTTRSSITYGNFFEPPHRRINFEIAWLAELTRMVVSRARPEWYHRPLQQPQKWWLDGG
jgi:hypothetical protein